MPLLPRSLFGRLTLVLLGGLVAAQLLSASILLRDRGRTLYQSVRRDLVERTAGIVRLLDALSPPERERLLPLLSTADSRIRLAVAAAPMPPVGPDVAAAAARVAQELRERLLPGQAVRVALVGPTAVPMDFPGAWSLPGMGGMAAMHRRMMGQDGMAGPFAYLPGGPLLARGFFIQVRAICSTRRRCGPSCRRTWTIWRPWSAPPWTSCAAA
jgi:hypothetical protein